MIGPDSHSMVRLVAEEPEKIVTIDFGVDTATFDFYDMISRVYSKGGPQSKTCQSMDMIIECSDEDPLVALPAETLAKAGQVVRLSIASQQEIAYCKAVEDCLLQSSRRLPTAKQ